MEDLEVLGDLVRHGSATPVAVKDEAFRLWVELGRSFRLVADRTKVEDRTLRNWAVADQWEQKRADLANVMAPGMFLETSFSLKLAAHNAGKRLQQIAYDAAEHGTKPDRGEVDALTRIVDRGGHSPISKPHVQQEQAPATTQVDTNLSGLSPAELMRRET